MRDHTPLSVELEFARQSSMHSFRVADHFGGSDLYVRNDLLSDGQQRRPFWGKLARLIVRWERRRRRPSREAREWAQWQLDNDDRIAAERER